MNLHTENPDDWENCPKGTLQSLASRSRQRQQLKRAALAVPLTIVAVFALAWGGWLPSPLKLNSATLICDQVVKLLPAYASNSLAASQRSQVEKHLKKCPMCAEKLRSIRETQASVDGSASIVASSFEAVLVKHFAQPTPPDATYRSELLFVAGR